MTFVDEGTTGAFRATWRKGNPRSLLRTIIANNPRADEARVHELFWREIEDDKELLRACVEYWADNNYRSLTSEVSTSETKRKKPLPVVAAATEQVREKTEQIKEKVKARVEHEARIILLDWIMPNEKRLGDCTGRDCTKIGGWLKQLAVKVPPTKKVSDILSEADVFKIWTRATK
jgi:hypothetical protein